MKLNDIIQNAGITSISNNSNPVIKSVVFSSKEVERGSLFVALKGSTNDGHHYIEEAIAAGAVAIVCERAPQNGSEVTIALTDNSHYALGKIASAFYQNPSENMKLVGVTGTNGKTTTVTLLYNLFTSLGYKCGLISTIENIVAGKIYPATHTTPNPVYLNKLMREMNNQGCEFCFMEVSSHALDQERIAGLHFCGAIFSNITHDHLDYHKDFLSYINAKKRLFDNLEPSSFALINSDDKNGKIMVQNCKAKVYTYSCQSFSHFNCKIIENTIDGMQLKIGNHDVWTRFIGEHNAYNLLSVYACAILLEANTQETLTALSSLESVAGRLEYIKGGEDITAVVDYAHTPDALSNVLKTLREVATDTQIVTVFGCGGDRDRSKRPQMAKVAAKYSDKIIVTSDNPRTENPEKIIEDIKEGFQPKELLKTLFITNRREAIKAALITAMPGAIVLIAGKGHETYQEINGVREHFSDKEEIDNLFKLM